MAPPLNNGTAGGEYRNKVGRLEGKSALITGAGQGMGRNTALLFAREGAKVALLDVKEAQLTETTDMIQELGGETYMMVGDISRADDVDTWVQTAARRFGRIDVLLNNAGVYSLETVSGSGTFYEATEECWDRTMQINLKGPWLCCRAVIPHMLRQGKGKIINIASGDGLIGITESLPYVCSKHGVVGLTRALAVGLAGKGICVNAICPANVDTPMVRAAVEEGGRLEELVAQFEAETGVNSLITSPIPMDAVSNLTLFLASDDSDYLHGRSIHVGAWSALIP